MKSFSWMIDSGGNVIQKHEKPNVDSLTADVAVLEREQVNITTPPLDYFTNPSLTGPTPITVENNRIFGHLGLWNVKHRGFHEDIFMPRSQTNYQHFLTAAVETVEGVTLPVGVLTMDTGHAADYLNADAAAAHYDNTGTAYAFVNCGEDSFGVWVSGAVLPGITDRQKALLRLPLSGDWRRVNNNLELVAALAVNAPGFEVPRVSGRVEDGENFSLVAAGMLPVEEAPIVSPTVETSLTKLSCFHNQLRADTLAASVRYSNVVSFGKKLGK